MQIFFSKTIDQMKPSWAGLGCPSALPSIKDKE
jgi:hypothetical protein